MQKPIKSACRNDKREFRHSIIIIHHKQKKHNPHIILIYKINLTYSAKAVIIAYCKTNGELSEWSKVQHSKHSRVCHTLLFETPLFIGVYATCNCTFRNLHLAVFSQFGNLALPLQFYMETYRSGHNGADSKSVREQSPASSNLAVSAKDSLKVLSFKEFSLLSQG